VDNKGIEQFENWHLFYR